MSVQKIISGHYLLKGEKVFVQLLHNPTIEDVLSVEARVAAYQVESGDNPDRRVDRRVRDFLIRIGVER